MNQVLVVESSREFVEDPLFEVIDGRRVELPPMGSRETYLASVLVAVLGPLARESDRGRVVGEMLFKLRPDRERKRRPDVAFVSFERWPKQRRVPASQGWEVVPDLAVEVVSPTDAAADLLEKLDEYFEAGVRRAWVVYPGLKCVYDYTSFSQISVLRVGDRLDGGDLLPGFGLPLAELFEVDLEDEPADTPEAPPGE
jgi:Uma2 family endonuclease